MQHQFSFYVNDARFVIMCLMGGAVRTKKGYGDFGRLSKTYGTARRGFPDESVDYILRKIRKHQPTIIDIGCGTGIATEQLQKKGADVIGTDIDSKMIERAREGNPYHIEYLVAPA